MDCFLLFISKYKLLIELLITIITIAISLIALFQNNKLSKRQIDMEKRIAEQQNELQKKQIKISLYEQKNEINKALNAVFDFTNQLNILFDLDCERLEQVELHRILASFINEVGKDSILYALSQAKYLLSQEENDEIEKVYYAFLAITTSIDSLGLLIMQKTDIKHIVIENIKDSIQMITNFKSAIKEFMHQELKLSDFDK